MKLEDRLLLAFTLADVSTTTLRDAKVLADVAARVVEEGLRKAAREVAESSGVGGWTQWATLCFERIWSIFVRKS